MTDIIAATLAAADFFRVPPVERGEQPHKEWQHFVVHSDAVHLIVNFNVVDDVWSGGQRLGRVIALARTHRWTGTVVTFSGTDVEVRPGALWARLGPNLIAFQDGVYLLSVALPSMGLKADLCLRPVSRPFLATNQALDASSQLSWLFVPRLEATGRVAIGSDHVDLAAAPAYHDHNWGRFRWGGDFSWEWGSVLPGADGRWSAVFMRMADRRRTLARRQALYLWRDAEPFAVLRDAAVTFSAVGLFDGPAAITIPAPMRLLASERPSDVPAELVVTGQDGAGRVTVRLAARDHVRVAVPDEHGYDGVTVLHEIRGDVGVDGNFGGEGIAMRGAGVLEVLRAHD
jgi:hypothetical protein